MKSDIIAYCTHPVAPIVKAMILANGHRIVDAAFAPEGERIIDGQTGGPVGAEASSKDEKPKAKPKAAPKE